MTRSSGGEILLPVTRIPIPIAIGATIASIAVVWWAGTRNKDFMTPRGGNIAIADLSPGFEAPAPATPRAVVPVNLAPDKGSRPGTVNTAGNIYLELGDLESAPGLSEYSEHASKGVDYLVRLATELESRGEFQRALLAWERVLDSSRATGDERTMASSAITRIRPTLPRWNIDPLAAIPVVLQIGSTRPDSVNLREAVYRMEKFLESDSGDQIDIRPEITAGTDNRAPETGPIAIALSGMDDSQSSTSLVRSTAPEGNDTGTLYRALLSEAYLMAASHLATLPQCVPPGAPLYHDDPERDFHFQITRLHWRAFARSLTPDQPEEVMRVVLPEDP